MPDDLVQLIERFRKELLGEDKKAMAELVRAYRKSLDRITAELARLDKEYRKALAAGEKPSMAWIYEHNRMEAFRKQVEGELARLTAISERGLTKSQTKAIALAAKQGKALAAELGVAWDKFDPDAIEAMLGITQLESPVHDLFLAISREASRAAEDSLVQGMLLGKNPSSVARELKNVLGIALTRAMTIARTETLRAHRAATRASYQANSDVVTGWIWDASADGRTCACCWAMHGTEHTLNEQLDGHPNCRCAMVPMIKGKPFKVTSGSMLFGGLPQAEQVGILGKAKWQAWKDGLVTLDENTQTGIVGRSYHPRWGWMRFEKSLKGMGIRVEAGKLIVGSMQL